MRSAGPTVAFWVVIAAVAVWILVGIVRRL